jgi:hypothetical protein
MLTDHNIGFLFFFIIRLFFGLFEPCEQRSSLGDDFLC